MNLSLRQPHWTLLLVLVFNLFLGGTVADGNDTDLVDLIDQQRGLSYFTHLIALEMYARFNAKYNSIQKFSHKLPIVCHTSSLPVPKPVSNATQMEPEALLDLTIRILKAWEDPLKHLKSELASLPGAPKLFIEKSTVIEMKMQDLLTGVKMILSNVQPEFKEIEDYPVWSGLASMQSTDEDTRLFAFYSLLRCLCTDTINVVFFLKYLPWQEATPDY